MKFDVGHWATPFILCVFAAELLEFFNEKFLLQFQMLTLEGVKLHSLSAIVFTANEECLIMTSFLEL